MYFAHSLRESALSNGSEALTENWALTQMRGAALLKLAHRECVSLKNVGGGGAPLTTGAIVADLIGTYIAPLPFIEHLAGSRLLSRLPPIMRSFHC